MTTKPSHGIIDGKTIELIVRVRKTKPAWGQRILNSAGAMAPYWTPEDDKILAELEQDRHRPNSRAIPK